MSWAIRNVLIACGIAGIAATASASVLLPATLTELAVAADAVVYARVVAVDAAQAPGTLRVEQTVTLQVLRSAKGSWPSTLRIVVPGGTVGRYRTIVPGAPTLAPGDEAMFFLREQGSRPPRILGLSQGLVRVTVDAATGDRRVLPPLDAGLDGPIRRGEASRAPVALATFEGRLAEVLAATASGARR